jgi:hypothetical protein
VYSPRVLKFSDGKRLALALGALALAAVVGPALDRARAGRSVEARLRALGDLPGGAPRAKDLAAALPAARAEALGGLLASWQTVGGCGAGASTGTGAGVKWVGRNVSGGLFNVQCQSNYVHLDDGYTYAVATLVTANLTDKWNVGVSLPWQYKYWRDPFGFGIDLSNEGIGDVNALVTRRLGQTNATALTLSLGYPTGGHKANWRGSVLRQDKQMGLGRATGSLIVDHTLDELWGSIILGGSVDYRGGKNELESYRAPTASLYSYVTYLLGPLAPAAGLSVNGRAGKDRSEGRAQDMPIVTVAANASIEWATDYFALLVGGSLPVDLKGNVQQWIVALGISVAPF